MIAKENFVVITALIYLIIVSGCKEKYLPEIKSNNASYLVVEGIINTGSDSTIFNLSRTFKLDGKAVVAPEKAAVVQVESETGTTYVLPETIKSGKYGRPPLTLDPTKRHRLRIRTKDNREYLSDFVESKVSPPIDKLDFDFKNNAINVYANTHDATGSSRYYYYNYIETEQYRSSLISYYKVENKRVVRRNLPEESIWNCWRTKPSNNILLGSTIGLNEDVMADLHLVSVPRGSVKIRHGYSILVKQSVLTKEGFQFFENLKKNTESVGSIFDAQPSQLFGNIRSTTDPSEIVIGFVSAGTITEKRVTLMPVEMPLGWFQLPPPIDSACLEKIFSSREAVIVANDPLWVPLDITLMSPPGVYDYTKDLDCVDCRRQGGTSIKPSYWPFY